MPRRARLDIPGALHHIMVRGIDKSGIFKDDQDRSLFVERLGQSGPAPSWETPGMDELGLSMGEIARHVGVTTSSIAKAVARLEEKG